MSSPLGLMVASSDEHFREMVRDNLANVPNAKVISEFQEVAPNLYIRVLQDLERMPQAGLIIDLSADTDVGIKALEKIKQASPDLYVMASHYHADGETVIACMRAGAFDYVLKPFSPSQIDVILRKAQTYRQLVRVNSLLSDDPEDDGKPEQAKPIYERCLVLAAGFFDAGLESA